MASDLLKNLDSLRKSLLDELADGDCWRGRLSSSALSTAVAIQVLLLDNPEKHAQEIAKGREWLRKTQNEDGGWGDTIRSASNRTATLLSWCVLEDDAESKDADMNATKWLWREMGGTEPHQIRRGVLRAYGSDRTFSAPILTMCAIAGKLGDGDEAWDLVPQLQYELAVLPRFFYRWLRLAVVSYAVPALIAVGLVRHRKRPTWLPVTRMVRALISDRALRIMAGMQPSNGGYLEAVPLTSFVTMSLIAAGLRDIPVVQKGIDFILASRRPDGSWAIDTDLATWITSMAVKGLACSKDSEIQMSDEAKGRIRSWLLAQQFTEAHPFTQAQPGGWAWTELPGGVPDADDTAGAILALRRLGPIDDQVRQAAVAGINWLLDLQNQDGGFPTFCRGWGQLPFDRSCPEITAHVLTSLAEWRKDVDDTTKSEIDYGLARGVRYLKKTQRRDGSWSPLWFGNELVKSSDNPTYGTALVIAALHRMPVGRGIDDMLTNGTKWLIANQNDDGGWGGIRGVKSTIEETSVALCALAWPGNERGSSFMRATGWLYRNLRIGPAPIGLYFASLWYYERLYPTTFAAFALGQVSDLLTGKHEAQVEDMV